MTKSWEKIEPERNDLWDYKELGSGAGFIGVFKSLRENVGPKNSKMWTFEDANGKDIDIWGCGILDARFATLVVGEEVKVDYLGKEKSKSGNSYHNFDVWKAKYDTPVTKSEEVASDEIPF